MSAPLAQLLRVRNSLYSSFSFGLASSRLPSVSKYLSSHQEGRLCSWQRGVSKCFRSRKIDLNLTCASDRRGLILWCCFQFVFASFQGIFGRGVGPTIGTLTAPHVVPRRCNSAVCSAFAGLSANHRPRIQSSIYSHVAVTFSAERRRWIATSRSRWVPSIPSHKFLFLQRTKNAPAISFVHDVEMNFIAVKLCDDK